VPGGRASIYGDHALGGVYYAIVTQNDDPDGPGGRVKVRYPWMPDGDKDQSFWAQICVPMIGDEFGTYTLPDVEDEVMVVFVAGDMNYPVVIGGGWSKTDTPPETNEDGKNDFRLIKSRACHRLIFDDTKNTKIVLSDTGDKHVVDVGAHKKQGSSPNAIDVPALGSDKGVAAVASSGTLNLWCPNGKLSVQAKGVQVTADQSVDVKGGSELTLRGASGATLSAQSAGKFQGGILKVGAG